MVEYAKVRLSVEEQKRILEEEKFRLPVSEKCALRLAAGPPCDRTNLSAWLLCFSWHRIRSVSGSLTLREVFRAALEEAKAEFRETCERK